MGVLRDTTPIPGSLGLGMPTAETAPRRGF